MADNFNDFMHNVVAGLPSIVSVQVVGPFATVSVDYTKNNTGIHRQLELIQLMVKYRYPGHGFCVAAHDDKTLPELMGDLPPIFVVRSLDNEKPFRYYKTDEVVL